MGQVRHGSATTTHAVRAAIQRSQASIAELSRDLGVNPKTVAKWRKRQTVDDRKTGPREPRSTVLSEEEEATILAFRRHTLLPLDDCLYALQPSIPHLTRSSLHRCLQRHGISRLPDVEGDKPTRQKFKRYDADWFREALQDKGIRACIPGRKQRKKPIKYDKRRYKHRNRIEIMFGRLKDWRRVATRYDRCPKVFLSAIALAAIVIYWL